MMMKTKYTYCLLAFGFCCLTRGFLVDHHGSASRHSFFILPSRQRRDKPTTTVGLMINNDIVTSRTTKESIHKKLALRRSLVEVIEKQIGSISGGDWKRLHGYLYRWSRSENNKTLSVKQVIRVLDFLSDNFDASLVRHIIQSNPRIFRRSVSTQLEPTLAFLKNLYSTQLLNHALRCKPELLLTRGIGYTSSDDLELMQVFLSYELQMSQEQIQKLKNTTASFLFQVPMHRVLPTVAYFRDLISEGSLGQILDHTKAEALVQKTLKGLILKNPYLFQLSLDANIKPRIEYLRDRCQLGPIEVAHLLQSSSAPSILALSIQENLGPTLRYLENVLLANESNNKLTTNYTYLKSCILAHPQILGLSLKNLRAKVTYLNAIGAHQDDNQCEISPSLSARVLKRAPPVFSLSLETNIIPTVEFLARIWGAESDLPKTDLLGRGQDPSVEYAQPSASTSSWIRTKESLPTLIGEYPNILTLSLQHNIVPTVSFFNKTGYIFLNSDWRPVSGKQTRLLRGRYIASSLHQRLLPRWHYIQERNRGGGERNQLDRLSLHVLASSTDQAFCKQMRIEHEDYVRYKKDAIPRLKFNSELESWLGFGGYKSPALKT